MSAFTDLKKTIKILKVPPLVKTVSFTFSRLPHVLSRTLNLSVSRKLGCVLCIVIAMFLFKNGAIYLLISNEFFSTSGNNDVQNENSCPQAD